MKNIWLAASILIHFGLSAVTLDSTKGKTEFHAVGWPSAINVHGQGQGPKGDISLTKVNGKLLMTGDVQMDLSTFSTGMETRDAHMKERYLEVGKYKMAILSFKDVEIPSGLLAAGGELAIAGQLNLHGEVQPMELKMDLRNKEGKITTLTQFKIKMSAFKIERPKFALVTVDDEVKVTTSTEVSLHELKEVL